MTAGQVIRTDKRNAPTGRLGFVGMDGNCAGGECAGAAGQELASVVSVSQAQDTKEWAVDPAGETYPKNAGENKM